ncbi:MAG: hypothetical protein J3K34DRAFT_417344 [Monoraphidium minutum]|nr:MAG: hypothetical protein J3K34DRAFT_417344 [Monoraphidium minutum]
MEDMRTFKRQYEPLPLFSASLAMSVKRGTSCAEIRAIKIDHMFSGIFLVVFTHTATHDLAKNAQAGYLIVGPHDSVREARRQTAARALLVRRGGDAAWREMELQQVDVSRRVFKMYHDQLLQQEQGPPQQLQQHELQPGGRGAAAGIIESTGLTLQMLGVNLRDVGINYAAALGYRDPATLPPNRLPPRLPGACCSRAAPPSPRAAATEPRSPRRRMACRLAGGRPQQVDAPTARARRDACCA